MHNSNLHPVLHRFPVTAHVESNYGRVLLVNALVLGNLCDFTMSYIAKARLFGFFSQMVWVYLQQLIGFAHLHTYDLDL